MDEYVKDNKDYEDINHYFKNQYNIFLENTYDHSKIIPMKGYSDDILLNIILLLNLKFNFAFIDGDHSPSQVYKDGVNTLKLMKIGGTIIFDDYQWEHNGNKCGNGIDKFICDYKDYIELVELDTYAIVKVIKNLL